MSGSRPSWRGGFEARKVIADDFHSASVSVFEAVIEFMTSYHSGSRGSAYGWVYFLGYVVVPLVGALAVKELRARRKRLLQSTSAQIAAGPLRAVAVVEQANGSRRVEGVFRLIEGRYELSLRDTVNSESIESTHIFETVEQLEKYLESNTVLRLGDFSSD